MQPPPRFLAVTETSTKSAADLLAGRLIRIDVRELRATVCPTQFALGAVAVAAPDPAVSMTPEAVAAPAWVKVEPELIDVAPVP